MDTYLAGKTHQESKEKNGQVTVGQKREPMERKKAVPVET